MLERFGCGDILKGVGKESWNIDVGEPGPGSRAGDFSEWSGRKGMQSISANE
jgi:hypothetical protein